MDFELKDEVALLVLRGGKANAIGRDFLDGLNRLIDRLEASSARAVIITGYEGFFSAGLELPGLIDRDRPAIKDFIQYFDRTMQRVFEVGRPVVAQINGHAIAGGCVLALMTDV